MQLQAGFEQFLDFLGGPIYYREAYYYATNLNKVVSSNSTCSDDGSIEKGTMIYKINNLKFVWFSFGGLLILSLSVFFIGNRLTPANAESMGSSIGSIKNEKARKAVNRMVESERFGMRVSPQKISQDSALVQLSIVSNDLSKSSNGFSLEPPTSSSFQMTEYRSGTGMLKLKRDIELSAHHLFVAVLDSSKNLIWYDQLPDPRLLRAEFLDGNDNSNGKIIYRDQTDLILSVPSGIGEAEILLYQPVLEGSDFDLKRIGTIDLATIGQR